MRRHEEAAEAFLAVNADAVPNDVIRESILGVARQWDEVETSGKGGHVVPQLARAMVALLAEVDTDGDNDPWDKAIEELTA
jgi:hypothetical protein